MAVPCPLVRDRTQGQSARHDVRGLVRERHQVLGASRAATGPQVATKLRRRGGWRGTPVELFASVEHHAECAGEFAHALEALDRLSRLPRRQVLVSGRPHRIELSDPTPDNGRAPGVGDAECVGGARTTRNAVSSPRRSISSAATWWAAPFWFRNVDLTQGYESRRTEYSVSSPSQLPTERAAAPKGPRSRMASSGPAWTRTRDLPIMSRLL